MPSLLESLVGHTIPGITEGVHLALPYLTQLSLQGSPLSGETIKAVSLGGIAEKLQSLSANEIIRQVRSLGFGVNRQSALRVIKALKGQIQSHEYIQSVASNAAPRAARVPLAGSRQTFKYHVRMSVTGRDSITGETTQQYVTVTSTRLITKAQAQAEAALIVLQGEGYDMADLQSVDVITYTRQNPAFQ